MKRSFMMVLAAMMFFLCGTISASCQTKVAKFVSCTSSDGFVNIRTLPNAKSPVVSKLYNAYGQVALYMGETKNGWHKVSLNGKTGWLNGKFARMDTFVKGKGSKLVTVKATKIYGEDLSGEREVGSVLFVIPSGYVITDTYEDSGKFYVITTAHDGMYIRKTDVVKK